MVMLEGLTNTLQEVKSYVNENKGAVLAGAAGAAALGVAGVATAALVSRKKRRRKISHTKRGWKADRSRRSKQKWEVAYRRKKRKAKKGHHRRGGIHYTKRGQPYIILKSGKARFVKGRRRKGR